MTKDEALQALENGKKLTHQYFDHKEWVMRTPDGYYLLEDGVRCKPSEFWAYRTESSWNSNWELFNPEDNG